MKQVPTDVKTPTLNGMVMTLVAGGIFGMFLFGVFLAAITVIKLCIGVI